MEVVCGGILKILDNPKLMPRDKSYILPELISSSVISRYGKSAGTSLYVNMSIEEWIDVINILDFISR